MALLGCCESLAKSFTVERSQDRSQITCRTKTSTVAILVRGARVNDLLNSHSCLINYGRKAVAIERRRRGEQQRPDIDIAALSVVKPVECI